ncbi:GPR42 protein, partial [Tricholaema leucomelas]|nr:GPR42 protein [Tricholaema leucomelas]
VAEAAASMAWPLPAFLCPLANFCFFSSLYLSSLFLASLSLLRYLGVASPMGCQARRRPRQVLAFSLLLWLLTSAHMSVVFVAHYHGGRGQGGSGGLQQGQGGGNLSLE